MARPPLAAFALVALAQCGSRPAHFAERAPVAEAHDDAPSSVPSYASVPEPVYLSEVYLHRPLRQTLDLSPFPESGDVNSMDEVPRSTWFEPRATDVGAIARGPGSDGPPRPPFTLVSTSTTAVENGLVITDSRGLGYEIGIDPVDRPEMRTAAAAIGARLVWALGYHTPPVFIAHVRAADFWGAGGGGGGVDAAAALGAGPPAIGGFYRVSAVRWPMGMNLGQTPEGGTRSDDSNDRIAHPDRRTLRALQVVAAWLQLGGLGPRKTVDAYEGAPERGHVTHYLVGLDEAFGAGDVVHVWDPPPAEGGGSPGIRLLTLGLLRNPAPPPTQLDIPAIGELSGDVDPRRYRPPLPYQPVERQQAPDAYWMAKRIASIPSAGLAVAIDAGKLSDERAQKRLLSALEARRAKVVGYWFSRVTPLEIVLADSAKLVLRDEAVAQGIEVPSTSGYIVEFLAEDGGRVAKTARVHARLDRFEVVLPEEVREAARRYLVLRITVTRRGRAAPRSFEAHLKLRGGQIDVLGVRH
jgi:hypothetical protein